MYHFSGILPYIHFWKRILWCLDSHEIPLSALIPIIIWHIELWASQSNPSAPLSRLVADDTSPRHLACLHCELLPWSYLVCQTIYRDRGRLPAVNIVLKIIINECKRQLFIFILACAWLMTKASAKAAKKNFIS